MDMRRPGYLAMDMRHLGCLAMDDGETTVYVVMLRFGVNSLVLCVCAVGLFTV